MWLHHKDWVCRREKCTFSLSAFVQESFLKALLPAWQSCGRPEETLDTQVALEAHSGSLLLENPERESSFQASSVLSSGGRRSLTELQEVRATGLFYLHSLFGWSPPVVGLFVSFVSHSHIPVLPSLPSARLCLSNITKCIVCKLNSYLLSKSLSTCSSFPISSGWSLHFPVIQVKHFSISLVPLSHTASNPSEDHYSSTFKPCPESNCFHQDLPISCLCYYNSLLTGLPSSLLFRHHSLFSIVSKASNGSPFYSKSLDNCQKFCFLKCGPFSSSTRGN